MGTSPTNEISDVHSLVRRFIKTAIAFLAVGLAIGVWMMARRELADHFPTPYEISAHTHAILVGFVMTMILGVALWLFPRPEKGDVRYNPALVETSYWLLTVGTAIRVAGELARPAVSGLWLRWLVLLAGTAQALALVTFFYTMWTRVRSAGSREREARGERF